MHERSINKTAAVTTTTRANVPKEARREEKVSQLTSGETRREEQRSSRTGGRDGSRIFLLLVFPPSLDIIMTGDTSRSDGWSRRPIRRSVIHTRSRTPVSPSPDDRLRPITSDADDSIKYRPTCRLIYASLTATAVSSRHYLCNHEMEGIVQSSQGDVLATPRPPACRRIRLRQLTSH